MGALATVFGWAFGSSAIPAGFLTDRLGSRQVLVYAFAGSSRHGGSRRVGAERMVSRRGAGRARADRRPLSPGRPVGDGARRATAGDGAGLARRRGQSRTGVWPCSWPIRQSGWRCWSIGGWLLLRWRAFGRSRDRSSRARTCRYTAKARCFRQRRSPNHQPEHEPHPRDLLTPLLLTYAAFVLSGIVYRGAITYLPKHLEEMVSEDFGGCLRDASRS